MKTTLPLGLTARAVVLVRCGKTGRPKFDRPFGEYPLWAQAAFIGMLTPEEVQELCHPVSEESAA